MSKEEIGRIADEDWLLQRPEALAVFNSQYTSDGERYSHPYAKPWSVIGGVVRGEIYEDFTTHAEALAWAFEKAEAGE